MRDEGADVNSRGPYAGKATDAEDNIRKAAMQLGEHRFYVEVFFFL